MCQDCEGTPSNNYPLYTAPTTCGTDASDINYSGANLTCIGVTTNTKLDVVLSAINTALCSSASLTPWSTFNYGCVASAGSITTAQQFAETLSAFICDFKAAYTTFSTTTINTNIATINTSINALNHLSLTSCSAINVINSDNLSQVITKVLANLCTINAAVNPSTANWNQCYAVSPLPTTVVAGFNTLIAQICLLKTSVASAATLPTFNNVGSCLPGSLTTTDTLYDTVSKIKTKLCTITAYSPTAITWQNCITSPGSSSDINAVINILVNRSSEAYAKRVNVFDSTYFNVTQTTNADNCSGFNVSLKPISTTITGLQILNAIAGTTTTQQDTIVQYYRQSGNAFAANAVLGTTDNFPLSIITNNIQKVGISTAGDTTLYRALILTPTATDPTIADGSLYYNSTNPNFRGKRSGIWNNILMGNDAILNNAPINLSQTADINIAGTLQQFGPLNVSSGSNAYGVTLASSSNSNLTLSPNNAGFAQSYNTMFAINHSAVSQLAGISLTNTNATYNDSGSLLISTGIILSLGNPKNQKAINVTNTIQVSSSSYPDPGQRSRTLYLNTPILYDGSVNNTHTDLAYNIYAEGNAQNYISQKLAIGCGALPNTGGVTDPITSQVDILSTTGYNQLRLRTAYTPEGSTDPNGNIGDVAWDAGFWYWKVSIAPHKWNRVAKDTTTW